MFKMLEERLNKWKHRRYRFSISREENDEIKE